MKTFLNSIAVVSVGSAALLTMGVLSIVSCNQNKATSVSEETLVLTNSAFSPGSKAPGFSTEEPGSEHGFIQGPGGTQSGDTGSINGPSGTEADSAAVTPQLEPSAGTSAVSGSVLSSPAISTPDDSQAAGQSANSNVPAGGAGSSTAAANASAVTNGGGGDGGVIAGGVTAGNDGGTLGVTSGAVNSGAQSGQQSGMASTIGPTDPIVASTSSGGSGNGSSSVSTSTANSSSGSPDGGTHQSVTGQSGDNGGFNGVSQNAGAAPDNAPVVIAVSGTSTNASATPGVATGATASQVNSPFSSSTSTSDNPTPSWASSAQSVVTAIQGIIASLSTSGGSANDGGVILNPNQSGGDTGNAGSGSSGGGSPANPGSIAVAVGNSNTSSSSSSGASTSATPSDGGTIGGGNSGGNGGGGSTGGTSGGGNGPGDHGIDIEIGRVCSARRSAIAYPNFIFFEEAKNPRLTLELVKSSTSCGCQCSCLSSVPRHASSTDSVLASMDLSAVNLHAGRFNTEFVLNVAAVKKAYPLKWRRFYIKAMVCDDRNRDNRCSDETGARVLSVNSPSFTLDLIPKKLAIDVWNGRNLTIASDPESCEKQYSPLVLDLAGDGFSLTSSADGVSFDLDAAGRAVSTAWTAGADDAFLVYDRDKNGRIDDGGELFGSATLLQTGKRALNGFEALRDLDANRDELFDRKDHSFHEVRLWLDKNHNGISEQSELMTLERANVRSISLSYVNISEVDAHGNQTRQRSTFKRRVRGKDYTLQIIDVWFTTLTSH